MSDLKKLSYLLIAVILALGLSISLQSLLAAWSPPTAAPPGANVAPPIYSVSTANQSISGGFKLGIGTVSPNQLLHVYKDSGVDNAEIDIQSISGAGNHWGIYHDRLAGTDDLRFWKDGNDRITFTDDGNVGIGTTNPGKALDIVVPVSGNDGGILVRDSSDSTRSILITSSKIASALPYIGTNGNRSLEFGTNLARQMIIDNLTGYVGIGTLGPDKKLDILDAANAQLRLTRSDNSIFADFKMDNLGDLSINVDGATNQLVLDDGGNVGIGNTTPNAKLFVGTSFSGNIATFGTTFTTNAGALGNVAGDRLILGNFGFTSSNNTSLGIRAYRTAAGSDWSTTAITLGMDSGNVSNAGGYLSFKAGGNVGIGTTNPGEKLTIDGAAPVAEIRSGGYLMLRPVTNAWDMRLQAVSQRLDIYSGGNLVNPIATFVNGGNVGIGTTTPGYKLDVYGIAAASAFLYSSDIRLKKDVQELTDSLVNINSLKGVSFKWKESGEDSIGLIAQDVEKIFPQAVSTNPVSGLKSVDYGKLVAPLIEAVKEQQKQITNQQIQIDELKSEMRKIKFEIQAK